MTVRRTDEVDYVERGERVLRSVQDLSTLDAITVLTMVTSALVFHSRDKRLSLFDVCQRFAGTVLEQMERMKRRESDERTSGQVHKG